MKESLYEQRIKKLKELDTLTNIKTKCGKTGKYFSPHPFTPDMPNFDEEVELFK